MTNRSSSRGNAGVRFSCALAVSIATTAVGCVVGDVGGDHARPAPGATSSGGAGAQGSGAGAAGSTATPPPTGGASSGGSGAPSMNNGAGAANAPTTSAGATSSAGAPSLDGIPITLRGLAQGLGAGSDGHPRIEIGVATDKAMGDSTWGALVAREFNLLGGSNLLKQQEWAPDKWNWDGDNLISWGTDHSMAIRGHVLVYPAFLPDWWKNAGYNGAQNLDRMNDTIETMLGHFQGKVPRYDVLNEVLKYNASDYADNILKDTIGAPEYIDRAFQFARSASPGVKLFYNENNADATCSDSSFGRCGKADFLYDMVKGMQSRGVPIGGVGFQMHLNLSDYRDRDYPSKDGLIAQFQRFGALGLEVDITEFDILGPKDGTDTSNDFQAQKALAKRVTEACLAVSACRTIIFWDGTDRDTWYASSLGQPDALPCPFDRQLQPKPFYFGVREALTDAFLKK